MIEFLAATLIASSSTNDEAINRFCAAVVGIPYSSDNFSDEEWKRFQYCTKTLKKS